MGYFIVKALAPIFVILALGYWAGKSKLVDNKNVALLNIFLMDFALPSALFLATVQTPWAGIVKQIPLVVLLTLGMWVIYALIYVIATQVFHKSMGDAAVLSLTVALPNYAALGLPILNGVLGEGSSTSLSVAIAIACGSVFMTPFCLMMLEASKLQESGEKGSMIHMLPQLMLASLKKPLVFGPIVGVIGSAILGAVELKAPELMLLALKPLGAAALAAALFLTGVILSARQLKINTVVILGAILKNIVQPFIGWGIGIALGLDPAVIVAGVLLIALSTGFFGVVFGARYGVQSPDAEGTLLVSTAAFVVTIPVFILLTQHLHAG
jgi:malonate transporter and related proteins